MLRVFMFSGLLITALLFSFQTFANDTIYENRRTAFIDATVSSLTNDDALCLQAYKFGAVDTALLNAMLARVPTRSTVDFDLVKLVRILFLSNGNHDAAILPVIRQLPYWVTKGDTLRGYWSENHMIMWMSSHWLMHEKYGFAIDTALETRLIHYLELKRDYGFYEFFSTTYAPYAFSGLVNLADFAQNPVIKDLAAKACTRLLSDLLMVTNDRGVLFAVAGRNYYGKYASAYNQNHSNLIYLLTGLGHMPNKVSHSGGFLATSTLEVDSTLATFVPVLDTVYSIGHTLQDGFGINSVLRKVDRVMFQWSSGGYFHPDVAGETAQFLNDSVLWNHVDFEPFRTLSSIPPDDWADASRSLPAISMSTVISGQDINVFKHHGITLTSINDFWKGKVGYQQFPCVATIGTTPVFTASGVVKADWEDRSSNNANEHLPNAVQKHNVVLLMYRPEPNNIILRSKDVALYMRDQDFDEIRDDSLWLLARQDENFVAVRRPCIDEVNNIRTCHTGDGESWVIVVGDTAMYGTFDDFEDMILQAQYNESWYYDSVAEQSVYYASITVDTISIDYAWGVNDPISSISEVAGASGLRLYPNPASNMVTLAFDKSFSGQAQVAVYNMMGQKMYAAETGALEHSFDTGALPDGIYMVAVTVEGKQEVLRLVKAN